MSTATTTHTIGAAGANLLGILILLFIVAVLAGIKLPLISGYRVALIVLVILGLALCAQAGSGRVAAINAWTHPISILGILAGVLILVITVAALIGKPLPLPLVSGERGAFIAIVVLMASKWVLTQLHPLLR